MRSWLCLYTNCCTHCNRCALQVFDAKDWDALLMRSIVPKLAWALQDVLEINPLQQDLAPFHWFTAWQPVLPQHHMVNLLEFRFFPAWQRVLQHWLSNNPNFDEVTRWYLGWKVRQADLHPLDLRLQLVLSSQMMYDLRFDFQSEHLS